MERWFVFIGKKCIYGIGALNDRIFFVGKEGNQDWSGKTLQEIKPLVIEQKLSIKELKNN